MRIAYICADLGVPVFGRQGCSIHVQEMIRALLRQGAEVDLFATRFDGAPPHDLAAVRVHRLPAPPKGEPAARESAVLLANGALYDALQRAGPFAMVYERYSLWSYGGMQYARERGLPGLLCPPGDPAALAEALIWLRHDLNVRAALGWAASSAVLGEHTWDAVGGRVLRIAQSAPPAIEPC
jgi:hypothetical protein